MKNITTFNEYLNGVEAEGIKEVTGSDSEPNVHLLSVIADGQLKFEGLAKDDDYLVQVLVQADQPCPQVLVRDVYAGTEHTFQAKGHDILPPNLTERLVKEVNKKGRKCAELRHQKNYTAINNILKDYEIEVLKRSFLTHESDAHPDNEF